MFHPIGGWKKVKAGNSPATETIDTDGVSTNYFCPSPAERMLALQTFVGLHELVEDNHIGNKFIVYNTEDEEEQFFYLVVTPSEAREMAFEYFLSQAEVIVSEMYDNTTSSIEHTALTCIRERDFADKLLIESEANSCSMYSNILTSFGEVYEHLYENHWYWIYELSEI